LSPSPTYHDPSTLTPPDEPYWAKDDGKNKDPKNNVRISGTRKIIAFKPEKN
jgi:hypothetical protein